MAFKRPAASVAAHGGSQRSARKEKASVKSTIKKHKTAATLSATKRKALFGAVKVIKAVPPCVRKMLTSLHNAKFSAGVHEEAICTLASILRAKDNHLQQVVCELQDQVDGGEAEKTARIEAQAAAESRVTSAKATIEEAKAVLDTVCKEIDEARTALAEGKAGRKGEGVQLGMIIRKKERLESTKENMFTPLKEKMAKGIQGQKKLKELGKVGKEFGFHQVLLDSMSAVLRKQPERRQTFDSFAVRSFSAEFSKTVEKMELAAQEHEKSVADHLAAEQAAENKLSAAKETRSQTAKNLSKAEAALAKAQKDVALTKQRIKDFPRDSKAALRRLGQARVQLSAFRTGPLAAIDELQNLSQSLSAAAEVSKPVGTEVFEKTADDSSEGEEPEARELQSMPSYQAALASSTNFPPLSEASTIVT